LFLLSRDTALFESV